LLQTLLQTEDIALVIEVLQEITVSQRERGGLLTFPSPDLLKMSDFGDAPKSFGLGTKKKRVMEVEVSSQMSGRGSFRGTPNLVVTYHHE
jgi:hypothetical protein